MKVINTNFKYCGQLVPLNPEKVLFLIVHHPDAVNASPEQIHQWHLNNGWSGFGYNEYIRKDGTVYIGRGDNIGAQCANMNSKSYGICCEGNYDIEQNMPEVQFNALVERIKHHKSRFKNLVKVGGHREFNSTSCPGKYFPLEKVIAAVNNPTNTLQSAINVLQHHGVISSPDYWVQNAVVGGTVKGDYAAALIKNMANKLKG